MKKCPIRNKKNSNQNEWCTACGTELTNTKQIQKIITTIDKCLSVITSILLGIISVIIALAIVGFYVKNVFPSQQESIMFTQFLIIAMMLLINVIVNLIVKFSGEKIIKEPMIFRIELPLSYLGILAFSLFWFGFLIVIAYFLISKKIENWQIFLILLSLFFVVGIIIVYSSLKKINYKRKICKRFH